MRGSSCEEGGMEAPKFDPAKVVVGITSGCVESFPALRAGHNRTIINIPYLPAWQWNLNEILQLLTPAERGRLADLMESRKDDVGLAGAEPDDVAAFLRPAEAADEPAGPSEEGIAAEAAPVQADAEPEAAAADLPAEEPAPEPPPEATTTDAPAEAPKDSGSGSRRREVVRFKSWSAVAKDLGKPDATVRKWSRSGHPFKKVGKNLQATRRAYEAWVRERSG
jgi:hypothetical protein